MSLKLCFFVLSPSFQKAKQTAPLMCGGLGHSGSPDSRHTPQLVPSEAPSPRDSNVLTTVSPGQSPTEWLELRMGFRPFESPLASSEFLPGLLSPLATILCGILDACLDDPGGTDAPWGAPCASRGPLRGHAAHSTSGPFPAPRWSSRPALGVTLGDAIGASSPPRGHRLVAPGSLPGRSARACALGSIFSSL